MKKKKILIGIKAKIKRLVDADPITIQDNKTMLERWGDDWSHRAKK